MYNVSVVSMIYIRIISSSEELKALYEKIKIQQSTLEIGQAQFVQRVKDVQSLEKRLQVLLCQHKKTQKEIAPTGYATIAYSIYHNFHRHIYIFKIQHCVQYS
jgi:hypothetical protein